MTVDQWLKLAETFVPLVQACIWPLLLLFILLFLSAPLKKFMQNMSEFTLKAGTSGIEATAKRQQIEAAALLGAAAANQSKDQQGSSEDQARQIATTVSNAVDTLSERKLSRTHILWVDDRPSNNAYERKAMETLGIRFTLSISTEDALEKARSGNFDLIISDMGRPPDPKAGYTLLEALRREHITTPFIIYAGSNTPEHQAETKRRGGFGTTNNPQELIQLVIDAIQRK